MSEYPVYTGMRSAGPPLLSRGAGFLAAVVVLPVFLVTDLPFGGYLSRTSDACATIGSLAEEPAGTSRLVGGTGSPASHHRAGGPTPPVSQPESRSSLRSCSERDSVWVSGS